MTAKEEAKILRDYCRKLDGKPSSHNTNELREKNRKKRRRREQSAVWKIEHPASVRSHVMKWRKKFTDKYNAYLRDYRRKKRLSERDDLKLISVRL